MATATHPQSQRSPRLRPSGKSVLQALGVIAIIWAALAIQAAVLGDRQQPSTTSLQQQIDQITAGTPQATSLPVDVSDQARAAAYDAGLPPAPADPVKAIELAFHVIGTSFSAVYPDGNPSNKLVGVQTYNVPPGGGATFELTVPNPGSYPFVTHSFAAASKGAPGVLQGGQPAAGASTHEMTVPATNAAASTKLTVMATGNKFDQKTFSAKAGEPITLTLMNHDTAVHNLHLLGLRGSDGKDVQTLFLDQGKVASIAFTPEKPGTYKFQCDVHPADMTGTLVVK